VHEEWFADTDGVRAKCGLVDAPAAPGPPPDPVRCGICFEDVPAGDTLAARCGHAFCRECWAGYVAAAVDAGPTALSLRCPLPKCGAAVPVAVIDAVSSPALRERYGRYELRSYVDDNRRAAWCPAPGCEHAVETAGDAGVGGSALDVDCACGAAFCFSCAEEAHRPVDCETVHRWIVKNSAESENMTWILANTKQVREGLCLRLRAGEERRGRREKDGEGGGGAKTTNKNTQPPPTSPPPTNQNSAPNASGPSRRTRAACT
jgi:ariadne-1